MLSIEGKEISPMGLIDFLSQDITNISNICNPNINLILPSQAKRDNMFSHPKPDRIFSHFSVTYLVYILFLLICGNYPLTSKMGRCRNLLKVDSRLNQIDPGTNIIYQPTKIRDTEPNYKY